MRIKLDEDEHLVIDMTNMIDCVFFLLIFFLVTTTFKKPESLPESLVAEQKAVEEFKIELPDPAVSAGASQVQPIEEITIDQQGQFRQGDFKTSRSQLSKTLHALASAGKGSHLRIEVDRRAPSSSLVELLDLLAYEGVTDYGIHTKTKRYHEVF
jgi:biopolymer transport protein ExbD